MQAVAHARPGDACIRWGNAAVTVIIAGSGVEQDTNAGDIAVRAQLNYMIPVLCFASVSIVHNTCFVVIVVLSESLIAEGGGIEPQALPLRQFSRLVADHSTAPSKGVGEKIGREVVRMKYHPSLRELRKKRYAVLFF